MPSLKNESSQPSSSPTCPIMASKNAGESHCAKASSHSCVGSMEYAAMDAKLIMTPPSERTGEKDFTMLTVPTALVETMSVATLSAGDTPAVWMTHATSPSAWARLASDRTSCSSRTSARTPSTSNPSLVSSLTSDSSLATSLPDTRREYSSPSDRADACPIPP